MPGGRGSFSIQERKYRVERAGKTLIHEMCIKMAFFFIALKPEACGTHLGGFSVHGDASVPNLAEEAGHVGAGVGHPEQLGLGRQMVIANINSEFK